MPKGYRLPATRELAGQLGLNRATVSAAYELLETEGLIRGHVGRGSFVADGPAPVAQGIRWQDLLASGDVSPAPAPASTPVISFATSRPSEELFPLDEFRASCREVIDRTEMPHLLQLGSPGGYAPLRRYLLEVARGQGLARAQDDIVIVNGCQQALDLLQKVLAPAGTTVLVEDPVYPGVKNVFARAGAKLVGVPVGAHGMDLEILERTLTREQPRLVLVTSDFQNPTGATLPLTARQAILKLARAAGAVVVENAIYGDLRYAGDAVPLLKQLDESGDTILLRSFSKVAFPGLRVGWILAPRVLTERLTEAKQWTDLHTDQLSQAILLRFAESGRLEAHRRRMVEAGATRLAAVLGACERELPAGARFTRPQGGMNLWVTLPPPLDAGELLARAQREGVSYLPGKYFAVSRHHPGSLRLSFAGLGPDQIRAGMTRLGRIFGSELERVAAAASLDPAPAMV